MEKYSHISEMENILNEHQQRLVSLNELLNDLANKVPEFKALTEYYYSDQRQQDLEDDEKGLIPNELKRGVLSEDAIYNVLIEAYEASVNMLELATLYLKHKEG